MRPEPEHLRPYSIFPGTLLPAVKNIYRPGFGSQARKIYYGGVKACQPSFKPDMDACNYPSSVNPHPMH